MNKDDPPPFGSLPVAGFEIVGIDFWGSLVYLTAHELGMGTGKIRLQISGAFRLKPPDGPTRTLSSEAPWSSMSELLEMQGATIQSLNVDAMSNLALHTCNGWSVEIDPDPRYEAWELNGPGRNEKRVATPGGGEPAIWTARPSRKESV
jgi:hypothetical protein